MVAQPFLAPNHVLYINMRPPQYFHRQIQQTYEELKSYEGKEIPSHLPAQLLKDEYLRNVVEEGLENGDFDEASQLRRWIDHANKIGGFEKYGLPKLELKVVDADPDAHKMFDAIVREGQEPAGIFASGSRMMLPDVYETNEAVVQTVLLLKHVFERDIPFLGLCFGMQMGALARFGILPQNIKPPPGMSHRLPSKESEGRVNSVSLEPFNIERIRNEVEKMEYGCREIKINKPDDPMIKGLENLLALKVHSQYVPAVGYGKRVGVTINDDIGEILDSVVAHTKQDFALLEDDEITISFTDFLYIVEIMRFGDYAWGTQFHPEFTPRLLQILSHIPDNEEFLIRQNQDIVGIRKFLRAYDSNTDPKSKRSRTRAYYPGEQCGINWTNRVLLPNHIKNLLLDPKTTTRQKLGLIRVMGKLTGNRVAAIKDAFWTSARH